jgi:membrane-bound lytic murein transglycosylase D
MPLHSHQRLYISIIIVIFVFATASLGTTPLLPQIPQLDENVNFWKKIFTDYLESEVVIHDSKYINHIYTVVNMDDLGTEKDSFRTKWRAVGKIKDEYKDALLALSKKPTPIMVNELTEIQKDVYELWQDVDDQNKYQSAHKNLRGQRGLRERFIQSLERSGKYMPEINKIMAKYSVPEELRFMPHVESSFNYKAYSKVGASGLWQFMRSTGRLYMTVNYNIDERLDPICATDAAARLLKYNYDELGSWPLAITAYNHGLAGMKRAKRNTGTDDFGVIVNEYKSRSFGFASRNFYAEVLAAVEIASNYYQYFGYVNFQNPTEYKEFVLPKNMTAGTLANKLDLQVKELVDLNPAWLRPIAKSQRNIPRGTLVRLPITLNDPYSRFTTAKPVSSSTPLLAEKQYKVEAGDNLSHIAQRFGTDVDTLLTLNDLSNPNQLFVGQVLDVPDENIRNNASAYRGAVRNNESSDKKNSNPVIIETVGSAVYPANVIDESQ